MIVTFNFVSSNDELHTAKDEYDSKDYTDWGIGLHDYHDKDRID